MAELIHGLARTLAGGIVSVLFGIILVASLGVGLLILLWQVGTFAVIFDVIAGGLDTQQSRVARGLHPKFSQARAST